MKKERDAFRAGLFILISIALILAIVVAIRGTDRLFVPMQERTVRFSLRDDVGGLRVGDDVRIGGYKVGQVDRIDVDEEAGEIRVLIRLPRRYELRQSAAVAMQGTVTGVSWINFESLGQGQPLTADAELRGRPSIFSTVLAELQDIAPQVRQTISDVRTHTVPAANDAIARFGRTADSAAGLANDVKAAVGPVLARYYTAADRTGEMMTQVRDLIGDTKTDFHGTMANLNAATGVMKQKLPALLEQLDKILVQVDGTVAGARAMLEDARAAAANTKDLSAAARLVLVGNKGKIDGMIASLKATSDHLKSAGAEIRRSPWRLLYKPRPDEMANLNVLDSARQFAEGAGNLSDAAAALRDAVNDPNAEKVKIEALLKQVQERLGHFEQIEKGLWDAVKP